MAEKKIETEVKTAVKKDRKPVKIKLPRVKGEDAKFVSINERTWLIKRGVEVEVPHCVYALLQLEEKALEEAYEYDEKAQNK